MAHEHETPEVDAPDPDAMTIVTVGVAGTIIMIIVVLFVSGLYESVNRAEFQRKVVAAAPVEIRDLRAAQLSRLNESGWVDKKNGLVAIPIDKAIELLAGAADPAAPLAAAPAPTPAATAEKEAKGK